MKENLSFSNKNEEKSKLLTMLDNLLVNSINEIPKEIIDLKDPNYFNYKVRGNWFSGAFNFIELAKELKYIPEDFWKEVSKFLDVWNKNHHSDSVMTTKEEIDTMDNFLIKTKEYIENK